MVTAIVIVALVAFVGTVFAARNSYRKHRQQINAAAFVARFPLPSSYPPSAQPARTVARVYRTDPPSAGTEYGSTTYFDPGSYASSDCSSSSDGGSCGGGE